MREMKAMLMQKGWACVDDSEWEMQLLPVMKHLV